MAASLQTADLCDQHENELRVATPLFRHFGGRKAFYGAISTIKCHEDNSLVRKAMEEEGRGRVLVIDGGGSLRCALVGDQLAALGVSNGWAGVIVFGCIRDAHAINAMSIGVMALATHPLKSVKKGVGDRDQSVCFAGVRFVPGEFVYADEDGIVVSARALHP